MATDQFRDAGIGWVVGVLEGLDQTDRRKSNKLFRQEKRDNAELLQNGASRVRTALRGSFRDGISCIELDCPRMAIIPNIFKVGCVTAGLYWCTR